MDDPPLIDETDPDEVFALLADDTRVAILQALWETEGEGATFSELREAVGMRDSGQFNYHLDKLVGRFVGKTADGYELTQAGRQINGAIHAGAYTMETTIEPFPFDVPCPTCGGDRTLSYGDDLVRVDCEDCPAHAQFGVPPSVVVDCDRDDLPEVAGRYLLTTYQRLTVGFCLFCDGPVRPSVTPFEETITEVPEDVPEEVATRLSEVPNVHYDCTRCGVEVTGGLRLSLLYHPAVVCFHHDRGVDVFDRSVWALAGIHIDRQRIRSREPFRASVTFAEAGDELTLTVDEDLEVVDLDVDLDVEREADTVES